VGYRVDYGGHLSRTIKGNQCLIDRGRLGRTGGGRK
jgi:hypothetical protein